MLQEELLLKQHLKDTVVSSVCKKTGLYKRIRSRMVGQKFNSPVAINACEMQTAHMFLLSISASYKKTNFSLGKSTQKRAEFSCHLVAHIQGQSGQGQ